MEEINQELNRNQNSNLNNAEEKRIVIAKYKRCSTATQELLLQDEILTKHINRMREDNLETEYIITNYEDKGISGKNTNRPGLQEMLKDIKRKKINLVIFTKLDRLARSLQDLLNTTTLFKNDNVNFIVVEQNIDTSTPIGRLTFHMIGAFSEFEREIINERTRSGRERARMKGSKSGKPCHRPKLPIDSDGVVKKFEMKMSMHSIARSYKVSITPIRRILKERGLIN